MQSVELRFHSHSHYSGWSLRTCDDEVIRKGSKSPLFAIEARSGVPVGLERVTAGETDCLRATSSKDLSTSRGPPNNSSRLLSRGIRGRSRQPTNRGRGKERWHPASRRWELRFVSRDESANCRGRPGTCYRYRHPDFAKRSCAQSRRAHR